MSASTRIELNLPQSLVPTSARITTKRLEPAFQTKNLTRQLELLHFFVERQRYETTCDGEQLFYHETSPSGDKTA